LAEAGIHKMIRWFITIILIISIFFGADYFNYGVVLALIYLMNRAPLEYASKRKR